MKADLSQIYLASRPYWATRYNDIHVPLAYEYARQLVIVYREANPDVVLPAILMHDNGWMTLSAEEQSKAFGPNMTRSDLRRQHELEGVRIADDILSGISYDAGLKGEILEIIDGHDSRESTLSLNDSLVKDADKMWRFSPTGLDIDHRRFGKDLLEHAAWTQAQIEDWFFTDHGKQMAQDLINLTLNG